MEIASPGARPDSGPTEGLPTGASDPVRATVQPLGAFTLRALVDEAEETLASAGVAVARSEARDLVAAVCDRPRFWPILHPDLAVDHDVVRRVRLAAERRRRGAPFAYAVGRAAFRRLTLTVDERVLIPRQETEVLVDLVLAARVAISGGIAVDVGTGSGAIALALATEHAFERVIATDVSTDALTVARSNARAVATLCGAPVEFRAGSHLAPLGRDRVDVIVCNPPYIAFDDAPSLPASVRDWEPMPALICGESGLAVSRQIIETAPVQLRPGGLLALEADVRRVAAVAELVSRSGAFATISIHRDLTGRDRFVLARRG